MGNILTYLKWRGDLTFQERPFCEVDSLVLAMLSYADLAGCVPGVDEEGDVALLGAWKIFQQSEHSPGYTSCTPGELLEAMAVSRRFQSARLSRFQNIIDTEISTQFAAVQVELDDGTVYISYRGTDETIVGWREDFCIGYEVTPAQEMAADYLRQTIQPGKEYRLGGHSKGGNLALYAALRCPEELWDQVTGIYCNDSPGLCRELCPEDEFMRVETKVTRILPGFSVIGTLFLYGRPAAVVESSADAFLQHDAFTWQIEGDRFQKRERLEDTAGFYVRAFDQWINSADMDQRKVFTKDFFDALEANGAKTITEVANGGIDGFGTILMSIINSESRTKIVVFNFIRSFVSSLRCIDFKAVFQSQAVYQSGALFLLGAFFIAAPSLAIRLLGTAAGAALFLWSLRRLYRLLVAPPEDVNLRKRKFALYVVFLCAAEFYVVDPTVILLSAQFLIGAILLIFAYKKLRQAMTAGVTPFRRACVTSIAVFAMILGVLGFIAADEIDYVVTLGSVILLYGTVSIANTFYRNGKLNSIKPAQQE